MLRNLSIHSGLYTNLNMLCYHQNKSQIFILYKSCVIYKVKEFEIRKKREESMCHMCQVKHTSPKSNQETKCHRFSSKAKATLIFFLIFDLDNKSFFLSKVENYCLILSN